MPESARAPEPVNGFGVADWLVEPLFDAAVSGLESLTRSDVPPRLIPLAGRRHRKLSPANRENIMGALGRHQRFTDAAFDRLFETLESEAATLAALATEEIIQLLEVGEAEVPETVSLLLADRPEDAQLVARWAVQKGDSSDTLTGIIEALSRENRAAQERLRNLDQELAHERRARRSLERKIDQASSAAELARAEAVKARSVAGWSQVERNAEAARAEELEQQLAGLQAAVEAGRRERRDLVAEQRDLQERYQRARQELRELRLRLPAPEAPPRLEIRPPEAAPTTAELRDRFVQFGARGVLESKHILLVVDGWNVGLAHAFGDRLEDRRRVLDQGLERYKSRTGNKVMVAYDGRKVGWFWTPRAGAQSIIRVFTEGETADDFIVGELEAGFGPDVTPVVVTSDKELRRRCIAQGAFVVSSDDLARELRL